MNKSTQKAPPKQTGRTDKTKRWLRLLTFCMMIVMGNFGFAQVNLYTFSQSTGTFTSIATDGDLVPGSEALSALALADANDTNGWTVSLPFTFNFNNNNYTSIYVNSNGGATFGTTTSNVASIISSTVAFEGAIGVMSRDLWGGFITSGVTTSGSNTITNVGSFHGMEVGKVLNPLNGIPAGTTVTAFDPVAGTITMSNNATASAESAVVRYGTGKIFTKTEGTAPNRVFVIEWVGYNDYGTTATVSNYMSFQLRLAETSNAVSVVYGDYFNVSNTNRTNQIGLRGASAADFNNRNGAVGNSWESTTAGTANNATVSRDNTNFPASGLMFTWTPPTCLIPTDLTATNITVSSADLGWTETNSATSWDIEWGLQGFTPTGTPSVGGEGVTQNPFTLGGLDTNTKYEFYVRSDCGTDDGYSLWAGPFTFTTAFDCTTYFGEITSTTGGTVCDEGTATLQATAGGTGDAIFWYDAPTGGNKIGEGTTVETPFITETTSFWATEVIANGETLTGIGIVTPSGTGTNSTVGYGMQFTVTEPTTLVSVDVLSTATGGDLTIGLYDVSTSTYIASHVETITGGQYHTIPLNFDVPAAGTYRLVRQAQSATIALRSQNATGTAFPYPIGTIGQLDGGHLTLTGAVNTSQYMFYNWSFSTEEVLCESDRVEAVATVHKIEVTASELIIDAGDSTTLSVTSNNPNFTYEWTWDGGTPLTGDSVVVSPTTHTTYILTATDSITNCEITQEIEILVYDMTLCNTIEILTTTDGSTCDEGTVNLSVTTSGTGSDIYWFDAPTGGNKVGQGASFETPSLTSTTSYWAAEVYLDGEEYPGQGWLTDYGTNGVGTNRQGLIFEIFEHTTLVDLEVWSTGTGGVVDIELYDMANVVVGNHLELVTTTLATGTTASPAINTVTLNWDLAPGVYKIVRAGTVPCRYITGVANFGGGYPIPFDNGIGAITNGSNTFASTGFATAYYYFFNWTFSSATIICESDREEVIASVHETIGITVSATETDLIPGESTILSVSSTNANYTYEWTWDDGAGGTATATGASITVSPTAVSTIYTVTATDPTTGCQTQGTIEILTFDTALCDDLEIATTTDGNVCDPGNTTTLQATGNSGIPDAQIFWYDAPTGGNKVGTGATFTTPALTTTTSYYAAEVITDGGGVGGTIQTSYTAGGLTFFAATNGVGITFAVQNTNSIPVTLDGLDFYMDAGTNQSYQLWYNATTITGAPGIINAANGWVSIAGPQNAAPTDTVNGIYPVFTGIDFEIPANTTYRFALTGTGAGNFSYYNDAGTPNSFSSEGINLLVGNNSAGGTGNVGYSGQNPYTAAIGTNPRFFHGALSFNSATILCESDREEVTATVHEIIDITVSATETTIDFGDSTTLTATSTNTNYEYVWTWDGGTDTGASVVVSPTEHTTYTVTATDLVTGCQTSEEIEILVYDMTLCDTIEILTTTDGSVCDEGTVTLSVTSSGTGSEIYWYDAPTGGNKVGQGPTFTTPNLTSTTSYWASEVYLDGDGGFLTGLGQPAPSQNINSTTNGGLFFTATDSFTLISVEVHSSTAAGGEVVIGLRDIDNGNVIVASTTITLPPGGSATAAIPVTVPLNFDITPGNYRLVKESGAGMLYNGATAGGAPGFPYPLGDVGTITGGATVTGTTTLYYFYYNWTISSADIICESDREEVIATVHEIIDIDVTATATIIDFGESTTISVSSTNSNYEYVWTWDGGTATGNTLTVSPTEHTTYTVTATDTVTGCQNVREIEILVYDMSICDDLEILTTTDGSVCDEGTVTLSATANGAGNEIYWFDSPTGDNKVGQGATFTTPVLTETTSYWASEVYLDGGGGTLGGQAKLAPTGTTPGGYTLLAGLEFVATESFVIVDVEAYSYAATGTTIPSIQLQDSAGNMISQVLNIPIPNGAVGAGMVPFTIPLNLEVPGPGTYRLMATGSFSSLARDTGGIPAGTTYPLGTSGYISSGVLTANTNTSYYYFYNWTISAGAVICESEREEVVATVHEIIDISISATASTIDPGDNTTLTVSSDNTNYTYEWTWAGGTPTEGESITVFPTDHTTYTVTATDTVTGCVTVREIKIYVYDTALCNVLEITDTTDGGICEQGTTVLYATGSGNGNGIFWFDAPTGGNKVGQGTSFTTPTLTSTTSYWAAEVLLEADSGQVNLGPLNPSIGTSSVSALTNHGMHFTVLTSTALVSVDIFPTAAIGINGTIEIREGNQAQAGTIVATIPYTTTVQGTLAAPVSQTVMIDVSLPPGDYILTPGVGINLIRNTTGASYPYTSDAVTITGNTFNPIYWYWFYNWQFGTDTVFCESDREEAVALVVPASTTPAPTGPANQLVYAGTTLAGLDVTGNDLAWYSNAALTNPIPDTTLAYEGTYYVTQTLGYCEGAALAITVTLHCPTPTALSATQTSLTEATLGWTGSGSSFDVEWGPAGFTLGNGTPINNLTTNSTSVITVADTPYQFYVRQDCGATDGISLWAGPFNFQTGYCAPVYTTGCTNGAKISNFVTTGALIDISNNTGTATCGVLGYNNFTSMDVVAVEGTTISFTVGIGSFAAAVKIWVDWNNNGVFEDTEIVAASTATIASGSTFTGSFTVPMGASIGEHRMRVRAVESTTVFTACSSHTWGETEDYTMTVITPPDCMFPQNLLAVNSSASSVTLSWTSTGSVFDIEYGPAGFTPGTGTFIYGVSNPYTLGGLTGGVNYQFYVRQDCTIDEDGYSIWRGPVTFTPGIFEGNIPTLLNANPQVEDVACANLFAIDVPAGKYLASLNVQYIMTSANPAWDTHQRSVLYSPSLEMGEPQVATHPDPQNYPGLGYYNRNVTFANGTEGPTTIEFQLKAWRTEGGTGCGTDRVYVEDGSWILNATFEDIPSCPNPPTDLGYSNITADSVDLIWSSDEAGTFQVKWGDVGFDVEDEGTTVPDINGFTHHLSGLDSSIQYEFYVRRDCSTVDEDFGEWVGPVRFNSGHCIPYATQGFYFNTFITTNAVENVTYSYTFVPPLGTGYVDNTDMIITENAGESFNFTSNYVGGASGLRIWVDWNNDFIFADDEEVYFVASVSGNKSGEITIPAGTPSGDYRMRVRAQQGGTSTPPACGLIPTGEALDFTLRVPCDEVAVPTGDDLQYFEAGQTLADLDVTGDDLGWYADEDLTIVLDESTELVHNTTYYVVNIDGNCQSDALAVTVEDMCFDFAAPTGNALQYFTVGQTLADLVVTGDDLVWYEDENLTITLDPTTELVHLTTYYVVSENEVCQSEALAVTVELTSSVSDFNSFGFRYYPNPVSEQLYLSANAPISDVKVINMLGQQVNAPANSDNTNVDMSGLPTGNYLIQVTIEGVSKMLKVVKK